MADFQRIFADHHPQPGYCLVLRPFNAPSDRAWGVIKQKLKDAFRLTDIKDLSAAGTIMDQILIEIARTDVVIVDITGNNPNVFFELGVARTKKAREESPHREARGRRRRPRRNIEHGQTGCDSFRRRVGPVPVVRHD